jgi:hypothetical protein
LRERERERERRVKRKANLAIDGVNINHQVVLNWSIVGWNVLDGENVGDLVSAATDDAAARDPSDGTQRNDDLAEEKRKTENAQKLLKGEQNNNWRRSGGLTWVPLGEVGVGSKNKHKWLYERYAWPIITFDAQAALQGISERTRKKFQQTAQKSGE